MQSKEILEKMGTISSSTNINSIMASKFKYDKEENLDKKEENDDNLFENIELSKFTIMSDLYEESIEDIINELGE